LRKGADRGQQNQYEHFHRWNFTISISSSGLTFLGKKIYLPAQFKRLVTWRDVPRSSR
jgi:hypothetical protein